MSKTVPDPLTPEESPPWPRPTKIIVVVGIVIVALALAWRFQGLIVMVVVAVLLAYLFSPVIDHINRRTRVSRGIVILIIYALILVIIVGGFFALGIGAFQQAQDLIELVPGLIADTSASVVAFLERTDPLQIGSVEITPNLVPWEQITNQLLNLSEPLLSQSGSIVTRFATGTVRTVINVVFVLVISVYLSIDWPSISESLKRFAERPGYRHDVEQLMPQLGAVWGAYLRGQMILATVIFLVVWLGLSLLGVDNALGLGLIAGLLEFIPTVGPVISAIIAMLVAFFQPENYLGLAPWQLALAVLALMILIQQLENHLLVPRIVGGALNLHPFMVIVGVFMGAALAGILGAILAAPIIASLKVLGNYTWRKLFDLPPFPEEEPPEEAVAVGEDGAAPSAKEAVEDNQSALGPT